ncbi:PH domain-containing protein [Halobacillus salinarum]|uniref:PH domain-containing protein n=1 Tax=Halobacillus salinarum TaxID=2932257 RepID=A0ABY4EI93_9BACI|nr:PH domain-containing protein [Halobacillus salinarum]UOQ43782.1 PH domain-containing protein [Halobacillus salinarum]
MKYPSKQDLWLGLLLWVSLISCIVSVIYGLITEWLGLWGSLFIILIGIGIPGFISWMMLTTYYVLTDEALVIRFGPFRKAVPFSAVTSIRKTTNPLSAPALSLKRIEILTGTSMALISPKDRDAFILLLKERCPQATIKD